MRRIWVPIYTMRNHQLSSRELKFTSVKITNRLDKITARRAKNARDAVCRAESGKNRTRRHGGESKNTVGGWKSYSGREPLPCLVSEKREGFSPAHITVCWNLSCGFTKDLRSIGRGILSILFKKWLRNYAFIRNWNFCFQKPSRSDFTVFISNQNFRTKRIL